MARFRFTVFGGVSCWVGEVEYPLTSEKQRHLLGCLFAADGRTLSRSQLTESLWPDADFDVASNRLKALVSALRKSLAKVGSEEAVVRRSDGYAWSAAAGDIDVHKFDRLVDEAAQVRSSKREDAPPETAIALLEGALSLVGGRPFGDLHGYPGLADESARLDERIVTAETDLYEARISRGQGREVIADLKRRLEQNDLDESIWYLLALAQYRSGRMVDAVRSVDDARRRHRDVGLELSPRIRELETRMLMHDPALDEPETPRTTNLPADISSFVGRRQVLDELLEVLSGSSRLVTLTGVGGIGKTRVAIETGRRSGEVFVDGCVVAYLASLRADDPLGREVARQLGVSERPPSSIDESLGEWIGRRHMLVILDNCEQIADEAVLFIRRLLRRCPNLTILATSRRSLHFPGERVVRLEPMASSGLDDDALVLLAERFGSGLGGDPHLEIALCRRLSGIPLAIELAASQVRVFGLQGLLNRLDDVLGALGEQMLGDAPHQSTLVDTLRWSHGLLSPAEQDVFAQMSVFRGGFTIEAATAVYASHVEEADGNVIELLVNLIDASLVTAHTDIGRFSMLEPVRQYAATILAHRELTEESHRRHLAHFSAKALEGSLSLAGSMRSTWLEFFDVEHKNLLAALGRSIESADVYASSSMVFSLSQFWVEHGHLEEGLEWIRRVEDLEPNDARVAADLARLASFHEFWMGSLDRADADAIRARRTAVGLDPTTRGMILHQVGNITGWGRGRQLEAIALFEEALALYEPSDYRGFTAVLRSQVTVAYLYVITGQPERADDLVANAKLFSDSLGGLALVDYAAAQIEGWAAFVRGDLDTAVDRLEYATAGFAEMGMKPLHAATLYNLAWAELYRGNPPEARALTQRSMAITWDRGSLLREAHGLDTLARISLAEGDVETAALLVAQSLEVSLERSDAEAALWASNTLQRILEAANDGRAEEVARHVEEFFVMSGVVVPTPVADAQASVPVVNLPDAAQRALDLLSSTTKEAADAQAQTTN